MKIFSLIGFAILCALAFLAGRVMLSEGRHMIKPYLDTKFSSGYTPEKFEEIKIGMELNSVKNIIGEPLFKGKGYKDTINTCLHYTDDGKLLNGRKEWHYIDLAWYSSAIEIDSNNVVIEIYKGWSYD